MTISNRRTFSAIAGCPVLVVAGVLAGGLAQLSGQVSVENRVVFGAAGVICFTAAILSLVVTSRMARSSDEGIAHGIIAGMLIRTVIAVTSVIVLAAIGLSSRQVAGGWILYWYLTFLVVEVAWMMKQLSSVDSTREAPTC